MSESTLVSVNTRTQKRLTRMSENGEVDVQPLAPDRQPWERQPDEGLPQYQYFKIFLEMTPPRTVRGAYLYWFAYVANKDKVSPRKLKKSVDVRWWKWAAKWQWVARAEAWDAWHVEMSLRRRQKERLEAQIERYELRQRAISEVYSMFDAVDPNNNHWVANFSRLVEAAMKLNEDSRKEYGDDAKRIDQNVSVSFADLVKLAGMDDNQPMSQPSDSLYSFPEEFKILPPNTAQPGGPIDAEYTEIPTEPMTAAEAPIHPGVDPPQEFPEKSETFEPTPQEFPEKSENIGLMGSATFPESEEIGEDLQESVEFLAGTYKPSYGQ